MQEVHSTSWLIVCVWLHNTHLQGQVWVYFKFSEAWLVEISVIVITEVNEANEADAYVYVP